MVPIQMLAKYQDKTKGQTTKIIYQNFLVNSAFSVRPLHFWKVKESREKTQMEAARLREEVKNIKPIDITPQISVKMHALFSLMDSKVVTGNYFSPSCIYILDNFQVFLSVCRHSGLSISKVCYMWTHWCWHDILRFHL